MKRREFIATMFFTPACFHAHAQTPPDSATSGDARNILNGWTVPKEGYCDQPYVVITHDGNWLCAMTTGAGNEGQARQHIVATISSDKGRTWTPLIDIEPADGPELPG